MASRNPHAIPDSGSSASYTTYSLPGTGVSGDAPSHATGRRTPSAVLAFERMLAAALAHGDSFGSALWLDLAARLTCLANERDLLPGVAEKYRERAAEAHLWARSARSREALRTWPVEPSATEAA